MRPARTPPSTFLFLPIQLSNSKAAKRPDNRSGQRPKRGPQRPAKASTRKGLKTRKNPPQPGQAQKARLRQVRRTPRKFRKNESPEKRNPRPPQSAAPLPMETIYGPSIRHVNRRKVAKASTNRLSAANQSRQAGHPGAEPEAYRTYPRYPQARHRVTAVRPDRAPSARFRVERNIRLSRRPSEPLGRLHNRRIFIPRNTFPPWRYAPSYCGLTKYSVQFARAGQQTASVEPREGQLCLQRSSIS